MNQPHDNPIAIAVIGAGPCGIGVGIAARKACIPCVLFDKSCVASSIGRYPTWLTFFSTADRLELADVPFTIAGDKPTRREALRYYQRLARHFDLNVRHYHRVTEVVAQQNGFRIQTRTHTDIEHAFHARNVVVATGYFDGPNRLDVPGNALPKLAYGYREAFPYFDQDCIVVGGGNSAADAALELHRWNARVTLVHFEAELDRGVKPWVRPDIEGRIRDGQIQAHFRTRIAEIRPESAVLHNLDTDTRHEIPNDWVIAMTGYTPDPTLLRSLGVDIDRTTGIPHHDRDTMRTNVTGVFIAGVITAGYDANKVFIENGRDHGARIVRSLVESGRV